MAKNKQTASSDAEPETASSDAEPETASSDAEPETASSDAEPETASPADVGPDIDEGADLQDHLQQLQFAAVESYDKLAETAAQLTEQARGVYETSQDLVRRNPAGYVLGAFALGCVLGVLLGRD